MSRIIGGLRFDNGVWTAPLAGVTDKAFRAVLHRMQPAMMFTEMVSAKALLYQNQKTLDLIDMSGEDRLLAVQLFGREPEVLAEAARFLVSRGSKWIDLNLGCPAPKIVKNGEGAALMRTPELAYRVVDALLQAVEVPISVKLRKGFDETSVNVVEMSRQFDRMGVSAITVHGRTRSQFYAGPADWDIIKEVVENVHTMVVGNGDILGPYDGKRMQEHTGCDAVMIARGMLGNPWLVAQNIAVMQGKEPLMPSVTELVETAKEHLDWAVTYKGERVGVQEMRKHLAWYVKNTRGAARIRRALQQAKTQEHMVVLLDEYAASVRRNDGQS